MFRKYRSAIKFIATGIFVLLFNLSLLYLLTDLFRIWYLASSVVSCVLATVLNFCLQKFWVFEERTREEAKRQFVLYVCVAAIYAALNTVFLYLLVDKAGIHYLLSQATVTFLLASLNFFINRNFVFVVKQK